MCIDKICPVTNFFNAGNIYLYYGSDFAPIRVRQLAADRLSFAAQSTAVDLVEPSNATTYQNLLEGAWLLMRNSTYYLFFSGNNCCGSQAHYAVMVARSSSATGPFELLQSDNAQKDQNTGPVILQLNSQWIAPGHNSAVRDDSGQDWMVYHAIDPTRDDNSTRVLMMDAIEYTTDGWPSIRSQSPSFTPQLSPVVNR